jgi:hypothetical protein
LSASQPRWRVPSTRRPSSPSPSPSSWRWVRVLLLWIRIGDWYWRLVIGSGEFRDCNCVFELVIGSGVES